MSFRSFERAVEDAIGVSIEKIRRAPLHRRTGVVYRRSTFVTHEEADMMFSEATGWSPPSRSVREVLSDGLKYVGEYFSRSKSR